jgi:hypothetical protein
MTMGSGAMPATYFDSTMCGGGRVRRSVYLDSRLVRDKVAGFLPQAHGILVLVNSNLHGGLQGDVAVFTTEPGWEETAVHEYAHVLGLADEYGCYVCDGTDGGRRYDFFDALFKYGPPDEPNVTPDGPRSGLKWGSMVASTTAIPTPTGTVPAGTVGMFESCKYYDLGLFRPEEFCKMRTLGSPFCAVCRSAISTALAPWTPTTTCTTPTATPASVTLDARTLRKFRIQTGKGGYEVVLDVTTNLPPTPEWAIRRESGSWNVMPVDRIIRVFINNDPAVYDYDHSVDVRATVTVDELDYWVPATSTFMTATATDQIALRKPDNAANRLVSDYGNTGNMGGPGAATLNFAPYRAGNGWLYLGSRKQYTRLAMTLDLDVGYFGPEDDPSWGLQSITWTPTPNQATGRTAYYDVTYDANGLCRLANVPGAAVDPAVGFEIKAKGKDAIGQSFDVTGRLIPTNVEYSRSISTIQIARIPQWEWPMQLEMPENVLEAVVDGVEVSLEADVLRIDDLEIELENELG